MRPSRGLSHPTEQPLALTSPPVGLSGTRSDVTERSPPSRLACLLHSLVRVSRRGTGCRLNASNLGTETWTYPCRTANRKGHAERQTLREHSESGRKPRPGPFEQGTPEPSPVEEDGPVPNNIERNDAISTPRNSHDARSEGYRSLRRQHCVPQRSPTPPTVFREGLFPCWRSPQRRDSARPSKRRSCPSEGHRHHGPMKSQAPRPPRHPELPSQRFHGLLNSLFKVLFTFPSRYLSAIGLAHVFSLGWSLPPDWGCNLKQPDSMSPDPRPADPGLQAPTGLSPSPARRSKSTSGPTRTGDFGTVQLSRPQFAGLTWPGRRFQTWALFPLRSPLLRESQLVSLPPLIDMLKFSG